ncbi:MAG: hypothetical protein WCI71_00240 [Bacteroidota bacterium]
MATMIRFKPVEIYSKICFTGKHKKVLQYQVKSISLVPHPASPLNLNSAVKVPEIFWQ